MINPIHRRVSFAPRGRVPAVQPLRRYTYEKIRIDPIVPAWPPGTGSQRTANLPSTVVTSQIYDTSPPGTRARKNVRDPRIGIASRRDERREPDRELPSPAFDGIYRREKAGTPALCREGHHGRGRAWRKREKSIFPPDFPSFRAGPRDRIIYSGSIVSI